MLHEAVLDSEGPSCLGAVGASFVEAKAACSADDAWVVPALPLHEAVRRSCRLGRDSTVYRPSHALHTPTHTLTHLHSPSHALTHPHTPSHTLTRAHSPPPHPDTPSHALTHPHSPSHALTHPHTPSHTLTRPTCPHTPHMPSHTLQVPSFYRLARDHTVFRTVREPAIFFLHFAVMGDRTESNCPVPAATSQPRVGRVTAPLTTAPPTAPHRPLTTTQAPVSSPLSASARLCCESGASRRGTLAARRALPPSPPSSTWASRARACWGTCMRTRRAQHGRARRAGGGSLGHRRPEALSPSRTPALWAPELHLGRLGPALQPKAPPPKSLIPPRLTHPGGVAREAEFEAPHQLGRAAAGAAGAARAAQQLRRSAAAMHEHRRGWPHTEAQLAPPLTRANATRRGSRGACTVATLPREPPLELPLPREWRDFGGSPRRLHRRPRARESAQHRARHGVS